MSNNNDTFKTLYDQLMSTEKPIQAMRHYLNSIPEEDEHHSLFHILVTSLEAEFQQLQQIALKSVSS